VDGVVLYDKPAGMTSHDVVAHVRRSLGRGERGGAGRGERGGAGRGERAGGGRGERAGAGRGERGGGGGGERRVRVGHAGTLDPFATGLLLVLVGRATRAQRFLMDLPKTYAVLARFGAVSTTGDPEGVVSVTGVIPSGPLRLPVGVVRQRPPAYSAVKVGGRRAYALARAGEDVSVPERSVSVYRFDELWRSKPGDRRRFEIECSSGTYVRSLIADLGDAYCEELRRLRIGPFDVSEADPERIVPLDTALGLFMPEVRLDPEAARRAGHGVAVRGAAGGAGYGVAVPGPAGGPGHGVAVPGPAGSAGHGVSVAHGGAGATGGVVRLVDDLGLIALAEPTGDGLLKPTVGFRG